MRARDAWPDDMSALARHLGTSAERTSGAPDVVICFVDELAPHVLERVERTTALGDDGVFHLHPRTGRPLGHLRLSDPPGSALLVVQRGLGYVPLLATALDLAALAHDWIPIPASPWRSPSTGVLVAGWRDGSANGDSVDAERRRAFLSSDGERMLTLGPGSFGAGVAAHERAGGGNGRKAPEPSLQMLVLVEPHDRDHVVAQRIPAAAAADWLADAVEAVLHGALGYRGESAAGLAGHGWYAARRAPHIAARLLRSAVQSKACYMVRYPTGSAVSDVSSAIESVLPTQRFDVLVTHPPAAAAGAPHGRRRSAPA